MKCRCCTFRSLPVPLDHTAVTTAINSGDSLASFFLSFDLDTTIPRQTIYHFQTQTSFQLLSRLVSHLLQSDRDLLLYYVTVTVRIKNIRFFSVFGREKESAVNRFRSIESLSILQRVTADRYQRRRSWGTVVRSERRRTFPYFRPLRTVPVQAQLLLPRSTIHVPVRIPTPTLSPPTTIPSPKNSSRNSPSCSRRSSPGD